MPGVSPRTPVFAIYKIQMPNQHTDHPDLTDQIAQHAAEILFQRETDSTHQAIRTAAYRAKIQPDVKLPTIKLVRNHLRALTQQALGNTGYQQQNQTILAHAEEIMTLFANADPQLVGRAAQQKFDGDVKLYLRIYTHQPIGEIADLLLSFGYEDPACTTAETKFGRFDRITFNEQNIPVIITRCPPDQQSKIQYLDLFTRKPIPNLNLKNLRQQLNQEH